MALVTLHWTQESLFGLSKILYYYTLYIAQYTIHALYIVLPNQQITIYSIYIRIRLSFANHWRH
jgi:hypothetical protein